MTPSPSFVRSRLWGLVVGLVIAGACLWPVTWEKGRDSFPLSSYPMFARREVNPTVRLHYAFGVDNAGRREVIGPEHVANSEVLQARAALSRAVRSKRSVAELCEKIAASIAEDDDFSEVVEIRIVTGVHDAVAFLRGDREGKERLRGRCPARASR